MSHEPIQFGPPADDTLGETVADDGARPVSLDLKKDQALTITWDDGRISVYPIVYLRQRSPSAEHKAFTEQQAANPLNVLSPKMAASLGTPLTAVTAELVGRYALRIDFSDGHRTGLYTWRYLRQIDPARM